MLEFLLKIFQRTSMVKAENSHTAINIVKFFRHIVILILKYLISDSQNYDIYALLTSFPLSQEGFGRYQRNEQKQNQKYSSPHLVDVYTT